MWWFSGDLSKTVKGTDWGIVLPWPGELYGEKWEKNFELGSERQRQVKWGGRQRIIEGGGGGGAGQG